MNETYRINDIERNLKIARFNPLDVLIIGGTGAGKSSTLNAMFEHEISKVGRSCNPETMEISSYNLNEKLRFWDTPGLGDSIEGDRIYSKKLIDMLYSDYYLDDKQYGLIDLVLVIIDGTGRDMGTTYKLLNDVIVPNFQRDRVLVAINQADMAMKGRHWDENLNKPDDKLLRFLKDKTESIINRVKEGTGVNIKRPVFYSAERVYNIEKLLDLIVDNMPRERRELVA